MNVKTTLTPNSVKKLGWKPERGGEFELLSLAALRNRKLDHWLSEPQRLNFHLLAFYRESHGTHMLDFEDRDCPANSLIHVSPNQVHAFGANTDCDADLLAFRSALLPPDFFGTNAHPAIAEYLWPSMAVLAASEAAFLGSLFHLLKEQQSMPGGWEQAGTFRYLALSVASFGYRAAARGRLASGELKKHLRYFEFVRLLEGNFRVIRGAQWYAGTMGCSYRTLCRDCCDATGVSPKALLDERVLKEARRLLGFSRAPIYEIAEELGFSESTNFVKFFQRLAGETPEIFRKKWISSPQNKW